ncbi:hypothetical protein [Falsirhodobacter halotolerans]|uniref:hypothetical protein n=1 Tax=Falsirhodobacter halotolerans TaxID=1146892 RepID=UPI001FD0554D|nr:hypothetical protein [Falsirhodobacter halotolerans]MCJ8139584.1 hypothetical protein [Falsirhodobacter halotolerans]
MSQKTTKSAGTFLPALALLFIGLKLTGHITWSWWWVLAPLWAPVAFFLLVLAIAGLLWLWGDFMQRRGH